MSFELKKNKKEISELSEVCDTGEINKLYSKKCGNNKKLLDIEEKNRKELEKHPNEDQFLYPNLDDPNFIIKIAQKKEFNDTKYDGSIYSVEDYAKVLSNAEYELLPQQAFVRNFLSFQTPYNSLLLFHGLGSGKTCSAIGVCEEMRDYLKQMGINKRIIIVASPNVQDNFKLQLFDERKLKEVDGIWTTKGCLGNKLLKEINPTGMKGLKREKVIQQVKNLINASYSFQGYVQFSNEIVRKAGKPSDTTETKIRNLQLEFTDRLIVIDEVHNIRISDDNENKNVAKNLMYLVSVVSNIRLLLLSATPMFNSYKEIVWLLNLMNMNDRRGIISVSDIFDKHGEFKITDNGENIGKEMLIRKATGYVSYIRGENPYTFPFRVYPDRFSPDNTFKSKDEYPKYQINGRKIPNDRKIEKLSLFLNSIGEYQQLGYNYIIDRLRNRGESTKLTRTGKSRKISAFLSLKSFGYTDLQIPIEALNIIYPYDGLEELAKQIQPIEYVDDEEKDSDDISPVYEKEKDITEEIDDIISSGPQSIITTKSDIKTINANSELESEPAVTEGIEGDITLIDDVVEPDTRKISSLQINSNYNVNKSNTFFDIIEDDLEENPNPYINNRQTTLGSTEVPTEVPLNRQTTLGSTEVPTEVPLNRQTTLGSTDSFIKENNLSTEVPTEVPSKRQTKASFKESLFKRSKTLETSDIGTHIIEGSTKSQYKTPKNILNEKTITDESNIPDIIGTAVTKGGNSKEESQRLYIDPKELTGSQGLKRIMEYQDTKTPAVKGGFEYKRGVPHVFKQEQIGKYSSKIKNVCDYIYNKKTNKVSDGIILIYSSYIDAGIIPMALALEEMGFTRYGEKAKPLFKSPPCPVVDVRTMQPPTNKKDFRPARYIMITGDPRISPNNDLDVKAITSDDNIKGEKIKVVLISQAGSEGLDFKAIRQVHILEPWYNINRIEQIIGRAVRNFSHKDLPFNQRNVQIFLYGTILQNAEEEAADLYIYRISELKAIKIGKVTRLLKQTAVDCIINHDQTQFTSDNFKKIEENRDIEQILSDHKVLKNFEIGDIDNSATCDFMKCEFDCLPDIKLEDSELNFDTYNETFMLINSDKIIQKIKNLMKMRYFYKKRDLFQLINTPKKYPTAQIYAALTQIITDNTEYISDKYGRTGYLINIGDYYLFQPSELNYKNISIYDRSVPLDYKHNMIKMEIKNNITKPVIDKRNIQEKILEEENIDREVHLEGKKTLDDMFKNYKIALETTQVQRGNDNWYEHCGIVIRKMSKENDIINAETDQERLEILEQFLIEHIVDTLMLKDKIDLLNYIYTNNDLEKSEDIMFKRFFTKAKKYLFSKFIVSKGITGIVIFNGPSRIDNLNIFILENNKWIPAQPEDKRDLEEAILKRYKLKQNLNHYVGFIGFETNKKYMVYKVKDTENQRSTGFRCDQSGKEKIINLLNDIESDNKYMSKVTKEGAYELCVRQEFTLRNNEKEKLDDKTWFLDTETAIINEFEKKEKKIK
jgi:Helicase conserved C-terminal domain